MLYRPFYIRPQADAVTDASAKMATPKIAASPVAGLGGWFGLIGKA